MLFGPPPSRLGLLKIFLVLIFVDGPRCLWSRLCAVAEEIARDDGEWWRDHNHFTNEMIAVSGCLRFFLNNCRAECGDGSSCRKAIKICDRWIDRFRATPRWRRLLIDVAMRIFMRG